MSGGGDSYRRFQRVVLSMAVVLAPGIHSQTVRAEELVDPTRPATEQPSTSQQNVTPLPKPDFTLGGIKIGAGDRSAIINGEIVTLNDVVAGATVVEISASRVVLSMRGERHVLPLLPIGDVRLQAYRPSPHE